MGVRPKSQPTLHDIARSTGLSVATVSRALHRDASPNVSDETRRRVREVARAVGYRPNLLGRSLVTGRTHTVSYWTLHAFRPYYAMVAGHISGEAAGRGYHIILNDTSDPANALEPTGTGADGQSPFASNFDGIIACDVAFSGNDYAASLRQSGVPLVGIGISVPIHGDFVGIDLEDGTEQALSHLLDRGCRRIAHVGTGAALQIGDPRAVAFDALMREAGLQPEWIPVRDHWRLHARTEITRYVQEYGCPEAIFCANDELAVGCYRGLADLGIEVPSDVLLIGCDGIEETEYHRCPITTIVAPVQEMCRLAWDFLEMRLREPDADLHQVMLKPQLVVRESTGGAKDKYS